MIRMGSVGLGMMGRHHARLLQQVDGIDYVGSVDPMGDQHGVVRGAPVLDSVDELIRRGIDAAIVAVPTHFHFETAMQLAGAGVHCLIEKPLAETTSEAEQIRDAFAQRDLIGAVGHVERCNTALLELRRRLREGQLGRIFSIATTRVGPFPSRIQDVGVVKDLATHDIDIVRWLSDSNLTHVAAFTSHRMGRDHEDLLEAIGETANNIAVSIKVNWISPVKERKVVVLGQAGALAADMLTADLTFFANGEVRSDWDAITRLRGVSEGDVTRYAFPKHEPLRTQLESFRDVVAGRTAVADSPMVSLDDGVEILRTAERMLAKATV